MLRAILVMAPFLFIACEKSTGEIGLGQVVDSKGVLGTKKSIPFITYNSSFDSIISTAPSRQIAGNYQDPYLGLAKAKFQTHLLLSLLSPDFGDQPVCDSVVMYLAYNGYYGDTSQATTFVVHELDEFLDPDTTYFSNKEFPAGKELGRISQIPTPGTLAKDLGDTISPALKLYLDEDFFQEKLINASRLSKQYFTSNEDFIQHVHGIQVSVENTTNGLTYFNVASLASFIRVYYRETPQDTVTSQYELYYGIFSSGNYTSVNSFSHEHNMGGPDLDNQDTINGEATIFAQAMAGVSATILLPNLKELRDSNWVINRAELVFPVRTGSVMAYQLPPSLLILENKPDARTLVDDYLPGGISVDGSLERGILRDNSYTFNISRLVHRYINTEDTIQPLLLLPELASSNGWRAVLNGNIDPIKPPQFNIYYTKTKD